MRIRSTPRLITAVAASLIGIVAAVIGGLGEVAVFVAPWFIGLALSLARRVDAETSVSLEIDTDRVMQGDAVVLTARVRSRTPSLVGITPEPIQRFRDRPATGAAVRPIVELARSDRPVDLSMPIVLGEWGTWELGRARVTVHDPLGFLRLDGRVRVERAVRVHPPTERLRTLARPHAVRRVTGVHPSRVAGRGVEFAEIRRYASGDSLRDINWRASARSGELQVSDRHPDRGADVLLLLDTFVESGHDLDRVLGMAVRACLAIAEGHLGVTDRVGLIELGGVVRWVEPGSGGVQLHRLTDALLASTLFANAAAKELPNLPPRIWSPRAVVVALTPLLDERFIDAVLAARGRGHDVAVIECSPFEPPSEAGELERLSLELWHAERAVVRGRLAEHGIATATWQPDQPVDLVLARLARLHQRAGVRAR